MTPTEFGKEAARGILNRKIEREKLMCKSDCYIPCTEDMPSTRLEEEVMIAGKLEVNYSYEPDRGMMVIYTLRGGNKTAVGYIMGVIKTHELLIIPDRNSSCSFSTSYPKLFEFLLDHYKGYYEEKIRCYLSHEKESCEKEEKELLRLAGG